jgi:hypothetical protein
MEPEALRAQTDNPDNRQASSLASIGEDEIVSALDAEGDAFSGELSAVGPILELVRGLSDADGVAETAVIEADGGQGFVTGKLNFALPSRDAATRRLALALFKENGHLSAKHRFRVTRYAHLCRLIERLAVRLHASGPFKADDDSKRALVDLARLSSEARSLEDGLGLVPPGEPPSSDVPQTAADAAYERIAERLARLASPLTGEIEPPVRVRRLPEPEPDIIAEQAGREPESTLAPPHNPAAEEQERERRVQERIDALGFAAVAAFDDSPSGEEGMTNDETR